MSRQVTACRPSGRITSSTTSDPIPLAAAAQPAAPKAKPAKRQPAKRAATKTLPLADESDDEDGAKI